MQTPTQLRMAKIVSNLIAISASGTKDAHSFANALDETLQDICGNDGFGTEGQRDPRGDGRNGTWSMNYVEGIDDVGANDDESLVQKRVVLVLERMLTQVQSDPYEAQTYFDDLDSILDALRDNDVFGSEGQNDPRGDSRDEHWSMENVQGAPQAAADEDDDDEDSLSYAQMQANVIHVLGNMIALAKSSLSDASAFSDELDDMLDDIRSNDGFGTEAQSDPRGDGRDGTWSMSCVEGIDHADEDDSPPEVVQTRVKLVLERILAMIQADEDDAELFSDEFESMLNYLQNEDVFGENNENDPRGDFTKARWSVTCVEGVDPLPA